MKVAAMIVVRAAIPTNAFERGAMQIETNKTAAKVMIKVLLLIIPSFWYLKFLLSSA